MKILIYSPAYYPSLGGLEFMAKVLAEEFAELGHRVTVVTRTRGDDVSRQSFDVIRCPALLVVLRLIRAADVVLFMNVSLRVWWALALVKKPIVISHHGPYRRPNGRKGVRDRIKYAVAALSKNIACSAAIIDGLPDSTVVIWDTYDDRVFRVPVEPPERDLVFVGRLVSDKGLDLLLRSLVVLRGRGIRPSLSVVGYGPEEAICKRYCRDMGLLEQVEFVGKSEGSKLARTIGRHRVMVVPSRNEPFGIVALEGIACGCTVVGSDAGGLPEAIGKCGITYRNGDVADLTRALKEALSDSTVKARCDSARANHLARFTRREVASRYLAVLGEAVQGARPV